MTTIYAYSIFCIVITVALLTPVHIAQLVTAIEYQEPTIASDIDDRDVHTQTTIPSKPKLYV